MDVPPQGVRIPSLRTKIPGLEYFHEYQSPFKHHEECLINTLIINIHTVGKTSPKFMVEKKKKTFKNVPLRIDKEKSTVYIYHLSSEETLL